MALKSSYAVWNNKGGVGKSYNGSVVKTKI